MWILKSITFISIFGTFTVGTVNFALPFTTSMTISISILQTSRCWEASSKLRLSLAFLSHNSSDTPRLTSFMNVLFWGRCNFPIRFSRRDMPRNVWNKHFFSYQTIWTPPLPDVTRHSVKDQMQRHHSHCNWYRIRLFTLLQEVSIDHLQWVWHVKWRRLLLRTPGPVPLLDLHVL